MTVRTIAQASVGLGLRAVHVAEILASQPKVAWFEVLTENYLVAGGPARANVRAVAQRYPLVLHGVGLYVGSAQGVDRDHLAAVRDLADELDVPWVSDHLCWGSVDGHFSHDLLPLPYTPTVARRVAEAVRQVQDTLQRPFLLENLSSYVGFAESTMTEWQFLSAVADQADCGILLDVNNIYVSSLHHGFAPQEYLAGIDFARVGQFHVAGFAQHGGLPVDTHDHPVADPVWDLYGQAVALGGVKPTLLEWDARIPPLAELISEAGKAERHWPKTQGEPHGADAR
ncbi:MAG: DUF692 domain-containing protein [Deltaproteobacteria bacterium]|nr:DUF692 domain-containing protein [Deltaproteobacteria bacterium]